MASITDKYEIREELGRGAFSIVKLAVEKSTGTKYAVKMINKTNVGQDMARLATEMEILKNVNHPNIINLKEVVDTKNCLFIVTELVTGGELFDKIVELGSYSEKESAVLVTKMVSAIDYLHGMGIVHRDLKPENLLLKDDDDISEVKLADFGLSKIMSQKVMMQTACGTPGYVAPEVLQAKGYDKEVDLWSIGVITYILLCGFPPFYNEKLQELFEQIMRADYDFPEDYWAEISDNAKNFISRLLVVDPKKRMTAKEALEHPWLSGHAKEHKLKMDKMKNYVMIRKQQSKLIAGELTF
jgi:calcium/calmodulin-dependent protein kinase I